MHPAIDKDLLISTPNYGKPVVFAPNKREECLRLKKEARQYYYPMMVLKHLSALSSGLMGKNNVFIKESCPNMSITPTLGEFPWPLKVDKASKKQKEIDITPALERLESEPSKLNNS